jgi:hypothetical protein
MTEKQKQLNRINAAKRCSWPFKEGSYEYHFDNFFDIADSVAVYIEGYGRLINDFEADKYALMTMELELKLMEDERAENSIQSNQGARG